MLRFGLSLLIYIAVGRWLYGEIGLYAPGLKPLVDSGLEHITIPRSDTWSRKKVGDFISIFSDTFSSKTSSKSTIDSPSHSQSNVEIDSE